MSKFQKKVSADIVINLLVAAYRERLEDDGDLVADELGMNWPNEIEAVDYDAATDCILFNADPELELPAVIEANAKSI